MKISQEPVFQPITIVLETAEEANKLMDLIDGSSIKASTIKYELSNWFSYHAQLGGKNKQEEK